MFELIESKEITTAKMILRSSNVLRSILEEDPDRYQVIEDYFEAPIPNQYTTEKRRTRLAKKLEDKIVEIPNSRLLTLLGQSLKWQQTQGIIVPNASYDLFKGTVDMQKAEQDLFAQQHYVSIKFPGKKTHAESICFSKNGQYMATGSSDGFIEIWNYLTGKIRKDLPYQASDCLMAMDKSVLSVNFSSDSQLLASGSLDGKIWIWRVKTGQCEKKMAVAHSEAITSLCFSKDNHHLLSGSQDQIVRIHGLKSGKVLKEFRGHSSFINSALYSLDGTRILSASSDGTVKIWDAKSTACLHTIQPQPKVEKDQLNPMGGLGNASVQCIIPLPKSPDLYLVCNKTNTLYIMSIKGQIVKTFSHNKKLGSDFVAAAVSSQGDFIYGVAEDMKMYCYMFNTGATVGQVKLGESEISGMAHHPQANVVVLFDNAGQVLFYKSL
ncbi:WD40-repeat-containing domain protein [Sporodiniella umbellata]|nr:WD40-repeat-containing domain protein [Sporodiniella umbellata]